MNNRSISPPLESPQRGGADVWDQGTAGQVLTSEFFDTPVALIGATGLAVPVAFGSATVTGGAAAQSIGANGLAVAVSLGSPTVTQDAPNNAIRFDSAADALQLTTRSALSNVTWAGYFYLSSARAFATLFAQEDTGAGQYIELGLDAAGTTLNVFNHGGGFSVGGALTVGQYYFAALEIGSGTATAYVMPVGGTSLTSASGTIANLTSSNLQTIGCTSAAGEFLDGRVALPRFWDALLSTGELLAEAQSYTPVRTANLLGAWFPRNVTAATAKTAITGANLLDGPHGSPALVAEAGPVITQLINASGLVVPVSIGTPTVTQASGGLNIGATGLAVAVSIGSHTVVPGAVSIGATGLAVPVATGSATVTASNTIGATGLAVPVAIGSPTVTPGSVNVAATGLAVPVSIGSPTVVPGPVSVAASGLAVAVSFGVPTVVPGGVSIGATGLAVPVAIGSPTVVPGPATVTASGLAVPVSFGSATITQNGTQPITASGLAVGVATGQATITRGPVSISAQGLAVAIGLGLPTLTTNATIVASGLGVPVVLGLATVFRSAGTNQTVNASGYALPVAFGMAGVYRDDSRRFVAARFGHGRAVRVRR